MYMKDITICYGLTEGSPVMSQTTPGDTLEHMTETVGPAMPEIEIKITNPETGEEAPTGEIGEICCRGYNVMKGYYNNPRPRKRPSTRTAGCTPATWASWTRTAT